MFPSLFRTKIEEKATDVLKFAPSVATGYIINAQSVVQAVVDPANMKAPYFAAISGLSPMSIYKLLSAPTNEVGKGVVLKTGGASKSPRVFIKPRQSDLVGASATGQTMVSGPGQKITLTDVLFSGDWAQTPTIISQTHPIFDVNDSTQYSKLDTSSGIVPALVSQNSKSTSPVTPYSNPDSSSEFHSPAHPDSFGPHGNSLRTGTENSTSGGLSKKLDGVFQVKF